MLMILSPSKTLDFERPGVTTTNSLPTLLDQSEMLVRNLRRYTPEKLAELMGISPKLAELNHRRFACWRRPFSPENAKPAVLAFKGDVYEGLQADDFSETAFQFAQTHLRILSGLYGLLRPLDLIQAYRLEMGTRLPTKRGKDLYQFWGNRITDALNDALIDHDEKILVNLASNEYFKVVVTARLSAGIITPIFMDFNGGKYRVISFYAKKARGMMARFVIQNRIETAADLKNFQMQGYTFDPGRSSEARWIFSRKSE